MKNVPEIAPEIRGLLEEIVADPRSMIRLVPRRALRTWFDTGETVRASDVTRTKAERHLIDVHREELAALLCEASWISYWKAPVLAHRPVGRNGKLYHPTEREPEWQRSAEQEITAVADRRGGIEALRQCLAGIRAQQGCELAQASLSLVPSDKARCFFALNVPWNKPRVAIALFRRILRSTPSAHLVPDILLSLAARTCSLGLFAQAREIYRDSTSLDDKSPHGRICAFNLSCVLGDEKAAKAEALELGKRITSDDPRLLDERDLLREWVRGRDRSDLEDAKNVCERISSEIPEVARVLCEEFKP